MGRQGIEPYNNARIACLSPRIVANLTAGDALSMKKINIIVDAKLINVLLTTKRFALNYAKYYRFGNIAHCIMCVQKQNCTLLTTCAKTAIVVTKLHIHQQVCKNKIAHNTCSVQKFGVFMNFANNTLQMMKEMMFLRVEMTKFAKYTLQNQTEIRFTKTSSFVI